MIATSPLSHLFYALFTSLNDFFTGVDTCGEKIILWHQRNVSQWSDFSMIIFA